MFNEFYFSCVSVRKSSNTDGLNHLKVVFGQQILLDIFKSEKNGRKMRGVSVINSQKKFRSFSNSFQSLLFRMFGLSEPTLAYHVYSRVFVILWQVVSRLYTFRHIHCVRNFFCKSSCFFFNKKMKCVSPLAQTITNSVWPNVFWGSIKHEFELTPIAGKKSNLTHTLNHISCIFVCRLDDVMHCAGHLRHPIRRKVIARLAFFMNYAR